MSELPRKIKFVDFEGTLAIIELEEGAELCRFDESSELTEAVAKAFLKAVVRLWNDQF